MAASTADKENLAGKLPFATGPDPGKAVRAELSAVSSQGFAKTFNLQSQIEQARWNLEGPDFFGPHIHILFDEISASLTRSVDGVAEANLPLGGFAKSAMTMTATTSALPGLAADQFRGHEGSAIQSAIHC